MNSKQDKPMRTQQIGYKDYNEVNQTRKKTILIENVKITWLQKCAVMKFLQEKLDFIWKCRYIMKIILFCMGKIQYVEITKWRLLRKTLIVSQGGESPYEFSMHLKCI